MRQKIKKNDIEQLTLHAKLDYLISYIEIISKNVNKLILLTYKLDGKLIDN